MKTNKVLVLGGTSESLELATRLAEKGFQVLVSRATGVPQDEPSLTGVIYRHGILGQADLEILVRNENIYAIIDCTHPYAAEISQNAYNTAKNLDLSLLVYDRPGLDPNSSDVCWAEDHSQGAVLAFAVEGVIFLSVGSKNIQIYVDKAGEKACLLVARVLPGPVFRKKCLDAGLKKNQIIQARGPFTVTENIKHLQEVKAKCIVTKDSGEAGGVPAKLEAARKLGLKVIMVRRPPRPGELKFSSIEDLLEGVDLIL